MNKRTLAASAAALVLLSAGAAFAATGPSSSTSSDYNPIASTRILDTRGAGGPITGGRTIVVPLGSQVPANATAVTVNVTVVAGSMIGYVLAYPDGAPRPATSSVDFNAGETIANEVTVPVTDGKIDLFNGGVGAIQIIVDVDGYFTPAAAPYTPPASMSWTLPAASQGEKVNTGGSAVSNATLLGTVTLTAGKYQVTVNAKATPNMSSAVQVFPAFFVYSQAISSTFAGDEFNIGSGALESGGNMNIDSYFSGSGVVTVPAAGETLSLYAFGYDSDRGAGSYILDTAAVTAVPLAG